MHSHQSIGMYVSLKYTYIASFQAPAQFIQIQEHA